MPGSGYFPGQETEASPTMTQNDGWVWRKEIAILMSVNDHDSAN